MTPPILDRRAFCLILAGIPFSGCTRPVPSPEPSRSQRLATSLDAATQFLLGQQSPDGSWRSDTYATFRDGYALTPLVMNALQALPPAEPTDAAIRKGAGFLAAMVTADGKIDAGKYGLPYPAYNAATTILALKDPKDAKARAAWLAFLRERQLTEDLGWQETEAPYGGWGYCPLLPRKPKPGEFGPSFIESNLSATLYALEALRAAGIPADDPAIQKALIFVQRCQNIQAKDADPQLDDGGFFFIYADPVRNKAGRAGNGRFHSYGSTSADGLRALLLCGLKPDHPRVAAARQWLVTNFRADTHPGNYEDGRELNREAIYFYYCASAAQVLKTLDIQEAGKGRWAEALIDALVKRQRPDGSWSNPSHAFREDDPMTATSFAVLALARCQ